MKIQEELKKLAAGLSGMRFTAPKSRNRHRELDSAFFAVIKRLRAISNRIEALQESCDTNMILFESLIDLYERGHVCINPDSTDDIKDFAKDLFGSMRSLIATYEKAKESSIFDSNID